MLRSLIVGRRNPWGGFNETDLEFIVNVHNRSVVEMRARGWSGHQTPMEVDGPSVPIRETIARLNSTTSIRERVRTDRWHLWLRWQGEYKGRTPFRDLPGGARDDYWHAIALYSKQRGCLHDGSVEDIYGEEGEPRRLCLLCKHYARGLDPESEWVYVEKGKRSVYRKN
jgi:hypothetical protein